MSKRITDKERLDWLDSLNASGDRIIVGDRGDAIVALGPYYSGEPRTIRRAIDVEIRASRKRKSKEKR